MIQVDGNNSEDVNRSAIALSKLQNKRFDDLKDIYSEIAKLAKKTNTILNVRKLELRLLRNG